MTPREKAELDIKLTEVSPAEKTGSEVESGHFLDLLILLAKRKLFVFKFVGIAAVLTVIVVLLLPNTYMASSKILPPQENQSMATTAILSQLSGPLGTLLGQSTGLHKQSNLYVAMLKSRTVADDLVDRFSLLSVYRQKLREKARKQLESATEIKAGLKDGVISISVEDRDPRRAADLANAYVEELDKLTRSLAVTEAGKRRIFFEREMKMASDSLADAEVALKGTQERTGIIQLNSQAEAMLHSLVTLRAEVAAQEVRVESMRTFATEQNPQTILAEKELTALREQLAKLERGQSKRSVGDVPIESVPRAGLEYARKLRDVKYYEALFELLAKQYEAARIDEAKDALVVQQMDRALPPERKSSPMRALIVISVTLLAFFVAVGWVYFEERMERAKEDPRYAARLQLLKLYLSRERKSSDLGA